MLRRWEQYIGRPFEKHDLLVIWNPMFWGGVLMSKIASRFD